MMSLSWVRLCKPGHCGDARASKDPNESKLCTSGRIIEVLTSKRDHEQERHHETDSEEERRAETDERRRYERKEARDGEALQQEQRPAAAMHTAQKVAGAANAGCRALRKWWMSPTFDSCSLP